MNKNDLIDTVVDEHDVTKTFARDLVDTLFGSITDAARNGHEVSIFGFGKFRVTERGARKGRNPKTGETIKIAASKRLKFDAASTVKTALNTKRRAKKRA